MKQKDQSVQKLCGMEGPGICGIIAKLFDDA
jgi:hypothetical protein